jgi:signal peptidase II
MIDLKTVPLKRNVTVVLSLCLVVLIFDQSTKSWADQNLATGHHPLPVRVQQKTKVHDALVERFEISDTEATQLIEDRVVVLLPDDPIKDPNTPAYPLNTSRPGDLVYIFNRGFDEAPRVLSIRRRGRLNKWIGGRETGAGSRNGVYGLVDNIHEITLARVIAEDQQQLSPGTISEAFEEGRVFVAKTLIPVGLDKELGPGQIALVLDRKVGLISSFLRFRYAENPGAAWSFMASASPSVRFWFFTVVASIAILVLVYLSFIQPASKLLPLWAYSMILGGAIGNLIDRIQSNFVIDFIDMFVGDSHWPTYNIADVGISTGVGLLLLDMFRSWRSERAEARAT